MTQCGRSRNAMGMVSGHSLSGITRRWAGRVPNQQDPPEGASAKAVGAYLCRLREAHGVTQAQLAQAAQADGLPWSRNLVAVIEGGGRRLDLDEMLLLPEILARLKIRGL